MPTIAEAVKEAVLAYAAETEQDPHSIHIWQGNVDLLHDAYNRAGRSAKHPIKALDSVMAAVRRSDLFEKVGRIRCNTRLGAQREVLYAAYQLRQQADGEAQG